MHWLLNGAYLIAAVVTAPIWLVRMIRTGKIRTDWGGRFGYGRVLPPPSAGRRRVLIHAVSVGEINAVRGLLRAMESVADAPELVLATTTDTGFEHAKRLAASRMEVVRYPFDISSAVERFLDRTKPDVVALVELEVWPNLIAACRRRRIPVAVINGRLTERSERRYRWVRPLIRPAFRALDLVAVQNETYAGRFASLGARRDRIHVLGTMKWDKVTMDENPDENERGVVPEAEVLAEAMGIDRSRPLIVAGSTAPEEHELIRDAVPEGVQLLCAPRRPEWFDGAAHALPGCARRSRNDRGSPTGRFLLDTIGELTLAHTLADLVVVGRTFVPMGGSDMIEPVALGKATIVGPHVDNFFDTAEALLAGGGLIQTDRAKLAAVIRELLGDPARRSELAERGQAVIRRKQGATQRHVEWLLDLIGHGEMTPSIKAQTKGDVKQFAKTTRRPG